MMFMIIIFTRIFGVLHCRHGKVHASGSWRDCGLEANLARVQRLDSLRQALQRKQRPGQPTTRRKNGGKDVPAKSMGRGVFTKARIARFPCIPSTNVYISVVCKVEWLIPPQNRDCSMYKHSVFWERAEKSNLCETWSLSSLCNLKNQYHPAAFSQPPTAKQAFSHPRLGVVPLGSNLEKDHQTSVLFSKYTFFCATRKWKRLDKFLLLIICLGKNLHEHDASAEMLHKFGWHFMLFQPSED